MLDALAPLALVDTGISPPHLTVPIALILFVLAFVQVSTRPGEDTIALLLIHTIVSFVLVALLLTSTALTTFPFAFSMLETILKLTNVERAILPGILTFTIWLTVFVLTCVDISISKYVCSLSMLQALLPLALVPVPVLPGVHPVALRLRLPPLPYVGVVIQPTPDSIPVL